jgi:hypothetical protein
VPKKNKLDLALLARLTREMAKPRITKSVREKVTKKMPFVMERELIQIDHQWVCRQCAHLFFNPACLLEGLTLNEIIQHLKKIREQAFVDHVCPAQDF